ncbi:MAG: hypothetical protein AABX16_01155 [Nanoarchaeota archaeon]
MSLQELLTDPSIKLQKPLSLSKFSQLLNYLSEKISAEISTTTSYTIERNPYLLENPPIETKRKYLSVIGRIYDTHTEYTVLFGAYDDTLSEKKFQITHIGFLPVVKKKMVKQRKIYEEK